jgi:hypothetical protein
MLSHVEKEMRRLDKAEWLVKADKSEEGVVRDVVNCGGISKERCRFGRRERRRACAARTMKRRWHGGVKRLNA